MNVIIVFCAYHVQKMVILLLDVDTLLCLLHKLLTYNNMMCTWRDSLLHGGLKNATFPHS